VPDIRFPDCGKNSSACQVGKAADDSFLEQVRSRLHSVSEPHYLVVSCHVVIHPCSMSAFVHHFS
jgi:hypothetical protein